MAITYRETKAFHKDELFELFHSVGWLSANYPERLVKAINGSDTVISAWDGGRLVGLVNALDDGELTAYAHYLLVNPAYHGMGIGSELARRLKVRYAGYLYLILVAEKQENVAFYEKHGFAVADGATPIQLRTL